ETLRAFTAQQRVADPLVNITTASQLPRDPARALPMIERVLYFAHRVAVIINFLETIFPAGDIGYLSSEDRNALVSLQRWMTSPRLMESDNLVILIAESLADVHERVRENARLGLVRIPYPDEAERLDYLTEFLAAYPIKKVEMTTQQLSAMTSGLNYVPLRSLLCAAQYSDDGLTYEDVRLKKKEIIEAECAGLIEFITPRYGLDSVGGLKGAKDYLRDISQTIRSGNREGAALGILP